MVLTNKQEEALKIAVKRYKDKEPYTCIAGYAGTGKSTVIKFIIAALNLKPEDDVAYVSFTGKAASVLRHKGCPNATTAHKLLYYSKRLPNGKYKFSPRKSFERPYKLIIVDEISMLPIDLWELLLSHKVPVIACGDPFQIPPISPKADNHVLDSPHVFLDEIMRQAQESEIVRLSMDIRNYKRIDYVIGFNADTSKLSNALKQLEGQLNNIASGKTKFISDATTKDITNAKNAALELNSYLNKAINVDTGKLDLSRLADSIQRSEGGL